MLRKTIVLLFCWFSAPAMAAVSVCSVAFLPETAGVALRHEVLWDYYDSWILAGNPVAEGSTDLQVRVLTQVAGAVTADATTRNNPGTGGHVLHYLPLPPDGRYQLQGSVQFGLAGSTGFSVHQLLDCVAWQGRVGTGADEGPGEAGEEAGAVDTAGALAFVGSTAACTVGGEACDAAASAASTTEASRDDRQEELAGAVLTGLVQAVDSTGLVLRTEVGRYVTLQLPPLPALTRRTDFTLGNADIVAGDQVGLVEFGGQQSLRIYRNAHWEVSALTEMDKELPPGVEQRGVLQQVERTSSGVTLHLTQRSGKRMQHTPARDSVVSVIEPASLKELQPYTTMVRVLAEQLPEGAWQVRSIEILH